MPIAQQTIDRVTVSVPHALAVEADSVSAKMNVSRSELYRMAVEHFIELQRRSLLTQIAAEMAVEYRADRNLTEFSVLDGEEFL